MSDPQSPSCKRRWWIAGLLNLLGGFGVGYVYVGSPHRALAAMATGAFCLVALWHGFGGWLALPWMFFLVVGTLLLLLIGSVVDAIRLAWNSASFVPRRYNRWWVYLALVLAWQGFASIWEARTVRTWVIPAGSMQPTLRIGDHLIGDMGAYRDGDPERGDVIIFLLPRDSTTVFIQRVIGLPGDEVQLTAGTLHINGKAVPTEEIGEYIFFDAGSGKRDQNGLLKRELLPEGRAVLIVDAAPNMRFDNTDVFKVPPGSYFVLGDNRDESIDSREQSPRYGVGYVPRANIIGKASWVYWSPDWGRIGTTIK